MSGTSSHFDRERPHSAEFGSTQWSVVRAAGAGSPESRNALEILCRRYWYPLYAYACRRVRNPHEAEELIQDFFARLLERNTLAVAEPARGRFRSFLLTSLRHFLANERDKTLTQKRGGSLKRIPIDVAGVSSQVCRQTGQALTPERLFEREWASTLLSEVLQRLRNEFFRAGKESQFEVLAPFLTGKNAESTYAQAAQKLGISEGAATLAAHRMRQRFRELLRAEIASTVSCPEEVEDEIRSLFASLGN
jgi:RNA polymerase sigma-70 factor (ECF subfamily)